MIQFSKVDVQARSFIATLFLCLLIWLLGIEPVSPLNEVGNWNVPTGLKIVEAHSAPGVNCVYSVLDEA